jgi:hypothetical protein
MEQFLSNFSEHQQMPLLIHGGENTRRFDDVMGPDSAPLDIGGIALLVDCDGVAIDDELAILSFNSSPEAAVDRVILEHVDLITKYQVVSICMLYDKQKGVPYSPGQ